MSFTNRDIADYYNQTLNHYQKWWKLDKVLAVHYGMWDKDTKSFKDALGNTNKVIFEFAEPEPASFILDAGCGVGGSAFFLAKQLQAKVTGVTLSERQIEYANKKRVELNLTDLVDFKLEDYTYTSLKDSSLDLIWAVESLTSAPDKNLFAKEAFRLLKPGGKLVIADYFKNPSANSDPNDWLKKWQDCWSLAPIMGEKEYIETFEQEGFALTKQKDVTENIYPTSRIMYRSYLMGAIPSIIYNAFHNTSRFAKTHYLSGKYQYKALRKGLWNYKLVLLTKI